MAEQGLPRIKAFSSLEAKSLRSRTWSTKFADHLTAHSSTPGFLYINAFVFIVWIVINMGKVPYISPFDPYPFNFLTMVVSIEAIFLSIFVLVSQNRAAQIATLREELHLRLAIITEQEITKTLEVLAELRGKMGISDDDPELQKMLQAIDTRNLEKSITEQLERADRSLFKQITRTEFPNALSSFIRKEEKKS